MNRIIYSLKDSTIYDKYPELNSGIDQIVELTKITKGDSFESIDNSAATFEETYNSRILIKFDITPIQTILNENPNCQYNCYLKLFCTEANSTPIEYKIYAYPLAEDWKNGNGNYNDSPQVTNGVSWLYKSGKTTSDTWSRSYSYSDTVEVGGGSWLTSSYATQSFSYESPDININVTNIITKWISGSIINNGFILKYADDEENNTTTLGSIKFYSKDTHTIYSPRLIFNWSDNTVYTGSFSTASLADINDCYIHIKNLKSRYNIFDQTKMRLYIRKLIPEQQYDLTPDYIGMRLPGSSYYSIVDCITGISIIDFNDDGTKILSDDYGHYLNINFNGFQPERFYKLIFKVISGSEIKIFDQNQTFKIPR